MDEALSGGAVTYAQAAYFVLEAVGTDFGGAGDMGAAFAYAVERGWLRENRTKKAASSRSNGSSADLRDAPIPLGELSFLMMKSFNLKGGYLYRLFGGHQIIGARYAYREMTYRGFITGITDPSRPVPGEKFFGILGKVLDSAGDGTTVRPEPVPVDAPDTAQIAAQTAAEEASRIAAQTAARELLAEEIRTEIAVRGVADTSVRVADEGVIIALSNIQFLPDSAELTEPERIKIMKVAVILSGYPGRPILVGGHTALAGNAAGRQQVSRERAQAVADFLEFLGCRKAEEMTVEGYGADRPLADNSTAEGQSLNRRVEITILDRL
jgi:outer membrane protein OmpA-like peptidoglycan-associated protein